MFWTDHQPEKWCAMVLSFNHFHPTFAHKKVIMNYCKWPQRVRKSQMYCKKGIEHNRIKLIIILSKYFPDSNWLKAHA